MKYRPTKRQHQNAKKLGVVIKASMNPKKKLDVYKDGKKIFSIGAKGYMDYELYRKNYSIAYAAERRRLYELRHNKYRNVKNKASYYADKILWK